MSLSIFALIFVSATFLMDNQSISKSSKEVSKDINKIKVSLVEPMKKLETKPIKKIVKKEKIKPKPQKKKIVKKIKEKPKKKIVKKTKTKEIIPPKKEEKIVKKEPIKSQNLVAKKVVSKAIKKDKNIEAKKIKELQNRYFAQVSETINKNKSYPRRAVLRNMQDDIKIEFIISPSGELISFFITEGKKIFYKSAKKAIEKSFPMAPPIGVLSSNTKVKLTLAYRLN
jgi:protein TonB